MRCRHNGLALIAVLWITAALSLLALSLGHMAKTDVRIATVFKEQAQARALADGALVVAADRLLNQVASLNKIGHISIPVGHTEVPVQIVPSTGLINVNLADQDLLTALFRYGAGLPLDQAKRLASNIITWRSAPVGGAPDDTQPRPRYAALEVPEDLRQVPGVTPDIYARVSGLIVASSMAMNAQIDPAMAPAGVLLVLANGDASVVQQIEAARSNGAAANYSGLNPAYLAAGGSTYFRLTAALPLAAGVSWVRSWWVDYSMQVKSVTPWRVVQVEPLRSQILRDW